MKYQTLPWIAGNPLSLQIPLQKVTITAGGHETTDYEPQEGDVVTITLRSQRSEKTYIPEIEGNIATITDNGTLLIGEYAVETLVVESDGTKRRSYYPLILNVMSATPDMLKFFDDFPEYAEGVMLDTPNIFFDLSAGGGSGDAYTKAQSDARYVKKVDMQAYSTTEEMLEIIHQTLLGYATIQYVNEKVQQVSSAWDVVEALDGTVTLEPYKYYVCGERDTLEIEVGPAITDGKLNEYMFEFDSPSDSPTILDVPPTLYSPVSLGIEVGKRYIVRIIGNYMLINGGTEGYDYTADMENQILSRTATFLKIPIGVAAIEQYQFANFTRLQEIIIPSSVRTIGQYAFQNCSALLSIIIPENVTTIGQYAFIGCSSLLSVVIQGDITTLNASTFQNCTSLKSIVIPESVKSLGASAFNGCVELEHVDLPSILNSIGGDAFYNCQRLKSITLPSTFTTLNRAFYNCYELEEIVIPESVITLTGAVFQNCRKLSRVVIEGNVTTIQASCFQNTALTDFPETQGTITTVQGTAFGGCQYLVDFHFPEGVTTVSGGCFDGCPQLRSVTLPTTMVTFGANYVFRSCPQMRLLTVHDTITTLNVNGSPSTMSLMILGTNRVIPVPTSLNAASKVYVDDTMVAAYKASSAWSSTQGRIYPMSEYVE